MPFLTLFWIAAGPVAVAVPVIIHLLNRRRFKIVTWAAMRFLLQAQRQNTRRLRLEQLLLLIVRTAIIALVVLAMMAILPWAESVWATFWPRSALSLAKTSVRTHHVIVLDASLSMNQLCDDGTCFQKARNLAMQKIRNAAPGDGFSVLLLKQHPDWLVGQTSQDAHKVQKELEDVYATHGNASLPTALNMISAKLAENAGRFPLQVVYFFTDMQKATWPEQGTGNRKQGTGNGEKEKEKADSVRDEINRRAQVIFVDVGKDGVSNTAVTDLSIEDPFIAADANIQIKYALHNFGTETRKNLRVELLKGRAREAESDPPLTMHVVDQQLVPQLSAGENKSLVFPHHFKEPGTYVIQVRIESDALPADDLRSMIVTVKKTIPVLLVNGKASPDRFDQATQFLQFALDPFPKGTEPKSRPVRPTVVSAAEFSSMTDNELQGYDALFFCDVGQLGPVEVRRLSLFLRLGGGIVFSTGDRVAEHLKDYNELLYHKGQGLLPVRLMTKEEGPFSFRMEEADYQLPPINAFVADPDKLALGASRFSQYLAATTGPEVESQNVRTILSFQREEKPEKPGDPVRFSPTNHPALLVWDPPLPQAENPAERKRPGDRPLGVLPMRYRGHVILFTSTFNMDWNSWPASPSYLSMMQELSRVAVSGKLRAHAYPVGGILEDSFATGGVESDVYIAGPDPFRLQVEGSSAVKDQLTKAKKVRTQAQGDVSLFRSGETELSGIYLLTVPGDSRERPFAVNFPAGTSDQHDSESDLSRVDQDKLKEAFANCQIVDDPAKAVITPPRPVAGQEQVDIPGTGVGPEVARVLLLVVLGLMFLEVVLAWQFGHHSAVDGVNSPPATGRTVPLVVAALAAVLFASIAFVLIHQAKHGDFLGFLPDGVRGWLEHIAGVPKAPPGEGTQWDLEYHSFLWDAASDYSIACFLALAAVLVLIFVYLNDGPKVRPIYKVLLGGLRLFLILLTLAVLLPRLELQFNRQGWPDIVLLVDDSRSMSESDAFVDNEPMRDKIDKLSKLIDATPPKNADSVEAKGPSRLQLVQALLAHPDNDWLNHLVNIRHTKVHIYHLDMAGRALKMTDANETDSTAGEITEADPRQIERAHQALAQLTAEGNESRLGTALRQVIDQYRGGALSAVIMFTDGNTTRDETIRDVADYAAVKGVPLYFVGLGDEHEVRDMRLDELQVADEVIVNDFLEFSAKVVGQGNKDSDMKVSVVLKVKDEATGKEKELDRKVVTIPANNRKSTSFRLSHQAKEVGRKLFIVELEVPKKETPVKTAGKADEPSNLRLERWIDIVASKKIKVLLVDGQARYDFRYLKTLLERELPDEKNAKTIELNVVLLDADPEYASQDRSALSDFPSTREKLAEYDVVILGDVDPNDRMLGEQRLKNLADFVKGTNLTGRRRSGGGLLFVAGAEYNPHKFKGTPLADVLPVVPTGKAPVEPPERTQRVKLEWTPEGRQHPIFRLLNTEGESSVLWKEKLQPMYWWATNYRLQPAAEVLAVKATGKQGQQPLIVQQFVGSGRSMFFGFDESWRWRWRENEAYYNKFWIQTIRYLARGRQTRTQLRLDKQTPYRLGEPIKVRVDFPDNMSLPGQEDPTKPGPVPKVQVVMENADADKNAAAEPPLTLTLTRLESRTSFEGLAPHPRVGKYRFVLLTPDVSKLQPDHARPYADATVELPPGEMDKLRLNRQELADAAEITKGRFYTLGNADLLLDELPAGSIVALSSPHPPISLWSNPLIFLLVMGLLTGEWLLRKRKHLL